MELLDQYLLKAKQTIKFGIKTKVKPRVIILMGLPGSGKSYVADYLNKRHGFTILSGENIAFALFDSEKCTPSEYKLVYKTLRQLGTELLDDKYNLVIDGTNGKYEYRKEYYTAFGARANIFVIYLKVTDAIALHRLNQRQEDFSDMKNILSHCTPEKFEEFKKQQELPVEGEISYIIDSDKSPLPSVDRIISSLE